MSRPLQQSELVDTYRRSRGGVPSAWYGHVPFGNWLTTTTRPRVVVELGTHNGVSFSSFCDAVVAHDIPATCFAIDTWQGDPQAGVYGEEVWVDWSRFSAEHYGGFARLLRGTFDEALPEFADGSIDLLHIDGLHTYEAVKSDFDNWLPKMSSRGVIIMHDIAERHDDFGVWQLWDEIQQAHPTFAFEHEHGLGVVAAGPDAPSSVQALVTADDAETAEWRARFAAAGERIQLEELANQLHTKVATLDRQITRLSDEVTDRAGQLAAAHASTSWRVTSPLRAVSRAASRFKGR